MTLAKTCDASNEMQDMAKTSHRPELQPQSTA